MALLNAVELNSITTIFVIFIVTLLVVKLFQTFYYDVTFSPPGPWRFPILGHLPILGKNPAKTLKDMSAKYGDVFMIQMGSWDTLILNSREVIREAMLNNPEIFSDRPNFFSVKYVNDMKGLAFGSYTPRWRVHRKIGNHVLRQFASIKSSPTEEVINKQVDNIIKCFLRNNGTEFDPEDDIFIAAGSIIYQICCGFVDNCVENKTFLEFVNSNKVLSKALAAGNALDMIPWLRFVMPWKAKKIMKIVDMQKAFVENEITNHVQSYDSNHLRDLCDGLISSAEQYSNVPEINDGITKKEIFSTLHDFLAAGFETVSTTLQWAILYIAYNKHIQAKIQEEISAVIGNRKPKLTDRRMLPYTEATILEVLRIGTIVPMSLPHATTSDTIFHNFKIKKGTVVFCNTYATARDSKIWTNPDSFCPERYLGEDNEIDPVKADEVLTFGVGRRRCPGEFLAKVQIFLFVVNIFQRFDIELTTEPNFEGVFGLTRKPNPYKIRVYERH